MVRGTSTINDVLTDLKADPVKFPSPTIDEVDGLGEWGVVNDSKIESKNGIALCGMARAAEFLFKENIDVLMKLASEGYLIRCSGHSLGGGVAALVALLVNNHMDAAISGDDEKCNLNSRFNNPIVNDRFRKREDVESLKSVRAYGFGVPACTDLNLATLTQEIMTSVVLHDDVVPRITPTAIRRLIKHLLHIRETWVRAHLSDDLNAVKTRVAGAWAPRWRNSFTTAKRKKRRGKKRLIVAAGGGGGGGECCAPIFEVAEDRKTNAVDTSGKGGGDGNVRSMSCSSSTCSSSSSSEDEFFEAEETLIESEDEESSDGAQMGCESMESILSDDGGTENAGGGGAGGFVSAMYALSGFNRNGGDDCDGAGANGANGAKSPAPPPSLPQKQPIQLQPSVSQTSATSKSTSKSPPVSSPPPSTPSSMPSPPPTSGSPVVVVEESPLPRMFIPGKIAHIYTHNGVYKMAMVPRNFRDLRQISLAANMLDDHRACNYYEALLEVKTVRNAEKNKRFAPTWVSYNAQNTCSCCASLFTWASTSNNKAQEARDKHNCRSCGALVCARCSEKKISLSNIGIEVRVRVCDGCFFRQSGNGQGEENEKMARSFRADDGANAEAEIQGTSDRFDDNSSDDDDTASTNIPKRRHSVVVDELIENLEMSIKK